MNAAANLSWLYLLGGWLLGGCAAALLLWALFKDRAINRRCPKCWYDMSGTPGLLCPECGRLARNERRLHRTRRKWRFAALAIVLGLMSYVVGSVPRYQRAGWVSLIPSAALVVIAPAEPETTPGGWPSGLMTPTGTGWNRTPPPTDTLAHLLTNEAWQRIRSGRLAQWQSQRFIERYLSNKKIDLFQRTKLPVRWPIGEPIPVLVEPGEVASLGVMARGPGGKWASAPRLTVQAQNTPAKELRVELGMDPPTRPVYRTARVLPIEIQGTRDTLLDKRESEEDNQLVRRALRPHVALNGDVPVIILYDRDTGATWDSIRFGVPYTWEVTLYGTVLLSGRGWAQWPTPTGRTWEAIGIPMAARDAVLSGSTEIHIRGSYSAATEWYFASPFDKSPACWTGEFSQRLELRPHPGVIQQMP